MKINSKIFTFFLLLIIFQTSNAQLRLPRLIRDSMILQRDIPVKIWGWANKKETISNPKYVRYAWADNPDDANLCNNEGLPASPFTTEK